MNPITFFVLYKETDVSRFRSGIAIDNDDGIGAFGVPKNNRVVQTICKHIMANNALTSAGVAVGVDESVGCRVVITGLEVIETCFSRRIVSKSKKSSKNSPCKNDV